MKLRNFLIIGLVLGLSFSSCKKEDDDPLDVGYTNLTDEENKEKIEDEGIKMVGELDQLKETDAVDVSVNLAELLDTLFSEEETPPMMKPIGLVASLADGDVSPGQVFDGLKAATEEPGNLTDIWEMVAAKYTWNPVTESWDSSGSADAIIFEFPGLETDATNTASLTIDGFTVKTITTPIDPIIDDIGNELPTGLEIALKYNSVDIITYSLSASYEDDGVPTSLSSVLTIDEFSWSLDITHKPYSEAGITASFKHADKILMEGHVDTKGNWTKDNIDENTAEEDDPYIENIIFEGNAYIQVMNIKVAGDIDVKNLVPVIRDLEEQYPGEDDDYTQAYNEAFAKAMNDHVRLIVVYADENKKIGEAEAYAYHDVEYNEWHTDIRFVFADGSKSDIETYFGQGFSDLEAELNAFIAEIDAEHGTGIGPTDFTE